MSGEQPRKLGNSGSGSGGRLKVSAPEFVIPSRASQPPRQSQGVQSAQFGDQGSYLTGSGLPVVASAGMPAFSTQLAHGAASVGSMGAPGGMVAMDGMQSMGQGPMYAGDAGMGMEAHAPPMLQGGQDATPWHQRVFQHLLAPATAMRFDALNGRLWCGLETGHVFSLATPELSPRVSVLAHHNPVTDICEHSLGVITVAAEGASLMNRGGVVQGSWGADMCFPATSSRKFNPAVHGMTSATVVRPTHNQPVSQAVIGGSTGSVMLVDFQRFNKPLTTLECDGNVSCMAAGRLVCVATTTGTINMYDTRRHVPSATYSLRAHTHGVASMVVNDEQVLSCGAQKPHSRFMPEQTLHVFDLRMMRQGTPIAMPLPGGPTFVDVFPSYGSTAMVASPSGNMCVFDTGGDYTASQYFQVDTMGMPLCAICVAPSGQVAAVADSNGLVHLISNRTEFHAAVTPVAADVEASPTTKRLHDLLAGRRSIPLEAMVDPDTPGATGAYVAQPPTKFALQRARFGSGIAPSRTKDQAASCFPGYLDELVMQPQARVRVSSQLIAEAQTSNGQMYIPNKWRYRANSLLFRTRQSEHRSSKAAADATPAPYVRPDPRRLARKKSMRKAAALLPRAYRKAHIKVGKRGILDFNFGYHNVSKFAGLEDSCPNAAFNAALQMLYFEPLLKDCLRRHVCELVNCVACELRWVFDMLDLAQAEPREQRVCQATNFFRMLQQLPEATALGFLDHGGMEPRLRMQRFVRFVMERVSTELGRESALGPVAFPAPDTDKAAGDTHDKRKGKGKAGRKHGKGSRGRDKPSGPRVLGSPHSLYSHVVRSTNKCPSGHVTVRETVTYVTDLLLPEDADEDAGPASFEDALGRGLHTEITTRAWCEKCHNYQPITQTREPASLPHALVVNAAVDSAALDIWRRDGNARPATTPEGEEGEDAGDNAGAGGGDDNHPGSSAGRSSAGRSSAGREPATPPSFLPAAVRIATDPASHDLRVLRSGETAPHGVDGKPWPVREYELVSVVAYVEQGLDPVRAAEEAAEARLAARIAADAAGGMVASTMGGVDDDAGGDGAATPGFDPVTGLPVGVATANANHDTNESHYVLNARLGVSPDGREYSHYGLPEGASSASLGGASDGSAAGKHGGLPPSSATAAGAGAGSGAGGSSTSGGDDKPWLVFNDFRIQQSSRADSSDFRPAWKSPCLLMFRCHESIAQAHDPSVEVPPAAVVPPSVFSLPPLAQRWTMGGALAYNARPVHGDGRMLDASLVPSSGTLVAIDAEFVSLAPEEAEVLPDGTRVVLRQARLGLGRVSCCLLRSPHDPSDMEVEVLMDLYISATEPIADHLTRFSGLHPGDLDPNVSRHALVDLKTAYLQLRCLIDRGCRFVGHGLRKDFRVLNMIVPDEQVVDTVKLLRLPNQQYLSLRFLASFLLNSDIQGTIHDSVEDAKTALQLYRLYQQLSQSGKFMEAMMAAYQALRDQKAAQARQDGGRGGWRGGHT